MPTIQDVAKRAGVASITVSRVINNSGYFSEETRKRVEDAIAELGYVPNRLARGLRIKQTNILALILTDITNPFFTTVARGVEDAAGEVGFTVTFCNTDESITKERKYLEVLLQQQVDGILLVPAGSSPDSVQYAQKYSTPVVILDRRIPDVSTDSVRCDSEEGAYKLVRLLQELGHRRIAILGGPEGISTADDRLAGYRRAMAEIGQKEDGNLVQSGSFTMSSGYEMVRIAVAKTPRPTAIFAANNFLTIGALRGLQDCELKVPEDVALVGFDDLPPSLTTFPFLTVAAQPAYEIAQIATKLLLARLTGEAPETYQEIILQTELIIRQSSGGSII